MEPIETLAKKWLDIDRDETTRAEITTLLDERTKVELEQRLRMPIAFGTAGLRSSMKAGFAHMNSVTVLQASHGLARYVLHTRGPQTSVSPRPSVVVAYDGRYNSEKFARLCAAAFIYEGFEVLWFGKHMHTPIVPFTVSMCGAAAGVMITASHNPKNDNGYKVVRQDNESLEGCRHEADLYFWILQYWLNGCQIVPPHDIGIAKAISQVQSLPIWDTQLVDHSPLVNSAEHVASACRSYIDSIRSLVSSPHSSGTVPQFVYTPMHGVGLPFMQEVFKLLECQPPFQVVQEQAYPDPEFPTVSFPNPEEQGALDLAKREAQNLDCSLILANDPDADRFAAAERLESGEWHQFTGNQMGVLLASYVLESSHGERSKLAMLASTVSSRMLAAMAESEGFHFRETLTGFKWLGNVAQALQVEGYRPVFAYEEAIGYMFPSVVWDKDGIAAAAVFLKACAAWGQQSITPFQKLQSLYERYGYFEDANTYLISPSSTVTNKVFQDIRTLNGGARPQSLGIRDILRWRDLTLGYDSSTSDNRPDLPTDASAQMITCELQDVVFTVRGSGTEPKIKLYIEATGPDSRMAKEMAKEVLADLLREWFRPEHGLRLPGTREHNG